MSFPTKGNCAVVRPGLLMAAFHRETKENDDEEDDQDHVVGNARFPAAITVVRPAFGKNRSPSTKQWKSSRASLRRSTNRQERSLDDQRTEIERFAVSHGYHIVRWYQDDGISGDSTECRTGFLALHKAACNGRNFDVMLVWDLDRFGRFDSLEGGYWIHPLRKAG